MTNLKELVCNFTNRCEFHLKKWAMQTFLNITLTYASKFYTLIHVKRCDANSSLCAIYYIFHLRALRATITEAPSDNPCGFFHRCVTLVFVEYDLKMQMLWCQCFDQTENRPLIHMTCWHDPLPYAFSRSDLWGFYITLYVFIIAQYHKNSRDMKYQLRISTDR